MNFRYSQNIAVNLRDREKAAIFYRDVLGMELVARRDCGIEMKAGSMTFWLDEAKNGEWAASDLGRTFFEFVVDDLEGAKALVEKHGCEREGAGSCGEAFLGQMYRDPFGLRFHLYQAKK